MNMLLVDLTCNPHFDVNCHYKVRHRDFGHILHDSYVDGPMSDEDEYSCMTITYITMENNTLIIEVA